MTKELDKESREILEAQLQKYREEPASVGVKSGVKSSDDSRIDIDSRAERVDKIISQYENIATLAQEIGKIIELRSKDVKVSFKPEEDITLRDSIRRIFGLDTNIVTYGMYKKCLELKEQLAEEDRTKLREQ